MLHALFSLHLYPLPFQAKHGAVDRNSWRYVQFINLNKRTLKNILFNHFKADKNVYCRSQPKFGDYVVPCLVNINKYHIGCRLWISSWHRGMPVQIGGKVSPRKPGRRYVCLASTFESFPPDSGHRIWNREYITVWHVYRIEYQISCTSNNLVYTWDDIK